MEPKRITIVEDDLDQRNNYADYLRNQGYEITTYSNRNDAEIGFKDKLPDLAVLDVMLENDYDAGFELCKIIKAKNPNLPVIFLTARDTESDKVSGLRLDAWDYLIKPITLDYLGVRISSLFRIANSITNESTQKTIYGQLSIEQDSMTIYWQNKPLDITLTEFWIIEVLLKNPGKVITYNELMQISKQTIIEKNTINGHIRRIRKKFIDIDPSFKLIKNVFGVGYKWLGKDN